MLKASIILVILTIADWALVQAKISAMTPFEMFLAYTRNEYPTRIHIHCGVFKILALTTVITAIITVIKW